MSDPLTFELRRIRLESAGPLRSARQTIADREVIVVTAIDSDHQVGWGECSALLRPGYTDEYLSGAWGVMVDVLVPQILADPHGALAYLDAVPGHPMARAALVGALVDLDLRARGRSLADALAGGSEVRRRVPSNAVIGRCDGAAEVEAAVTDALRAGHASVKMKIDPMSGLDTVRNVRRQWPDLPLAVDANGSYSDADHAIEELRRLEQAAGHLTYIEQPLDRDDLVGTAILARQLESRIALDESITTLGQATTALSLGAMGVLNLKPARVGGPLAALTLARIVAAEGHEVFCGGMVESGIGRAATLAVAAQLECTLPCDLGPSARYHRTDVTEPFELTNGELNVPDGPGIGVNPDRALLDRHTIELCRV